LRSLKNSNKEEKH